LAIRNSDQGRDIYQHQETLDGQQHRRGQPLDVSNGRRHTWGLTFSACLLTFSASRLSVSSVSPGIDFAFSVQPVFDFVSGREAALLGTLVREIGNTPVALGCGQSMRYE
jgi:hypothetical protein